MHYTNMSDGRNFTDYRTPSEQIDTIRKMYNVSDSKSLRYAMIQNAEHIQNKPTCTYKSSQGMSVLCGGPMSQYTSKPSQMKEFPKQPLDHRNV